MYGEIVAFDGDVRGMVQDIRSKEIGCILFGHANTIGEGSRAMRTGKMAGIPVGEGFLGRVVDALGNPIDNKGEIELPDTVRWSPRRRVSSNVSRLIPRWRPVSSRSIRCSRSDADSVS